MGVRRRRHDRQGRRPRCILDRPEVPRHARDRGQVHDALVIDHNICESAIRFQVVQDVAVPPTVATHRRRREEQVFAITPSDLGREELAVQLPVYVALRDVELLGELLRNAYRELTRRQLHIRVVTHVVDM